MSETPITREAAEALLSEWADQAQELFLFIIHGEPAALVTQWVGTLTNHTRSHPGLFFHTSGKTTNHFDTSKFTEFMKVDVEGVPALRLRRRAGSAGLVEAILSVIPRSGDISKLPILTNWIQ